MPVNHIQAVDGGQDGPVSGCLVNTRTSRRGSLPRSVRMCQTGSHVLVLRNRLTGSLSVSPFRCNSWRCPGCQRFKGRQDFTRVRDGMSRLGPHWVYIVLTLKQSDFENEWAAYRAGVFLWNKLSKRLIRLFGILAYVQTWEKHQSGFPHVNLAVHNEKIWELCKGDGWRKFRKFLRPILMECGFGYVVHVAPLRRGGTLTMVGYLTKLSRELTGSSVKNQVPVNAPPGFRRLRASRGLLAPIFRPGIHEGVLVRADMAGFVDLSPEALKLGQTSILGQRGLKMAVN